VLDRRAFALPGAVLALLSGRALAQGPADPAEAGAPDAGAIAAEAGVTAPPVEPAAPPSESAQSEAGGLFEKSQPAASEVAAMAAPSPTPLRLNGYMRGDVFVGKIPAVRQADIKAAYGELALLARTAKSPYGEGFAEARVRYGLQGDQHQTFLDLREAYATAYLGPLDLRVGKQIIVWGRADLLNPTNNLTPSDFRIRSPIEDDRRVGNVGARLFLRLAPLPLRLEGVWMPSYVATELPPVGLPQFVSFGTPVYPSPRAENWLEAGRLHLELPSVEVSVSYLCGYAPLPGVSLTNLTFHDPSVENMDPSVVIARTAYKHQVIGFDFSTALGDIVAVRGEAAYRRPFNYKSHIYAPRPDLQYALGLDHAFGPVAVIVQYLGRYTFDWKKETEPVMKLDPTVLEMTPAEAVPFVDSYTNTINSELSRINQMIFSQTERIQHLATARVEWLTLHEVLSLSAVGMYNVSTREWLTTPRIGYHLSDQMIAYVGAEVGSGPHGTIFGLVDQLMSAGYLELRSTF